MVKRKPMMLSDDFKLRMDALQKSIMMKKGEFVSLTKISQQIAKMPEFKDIENKILNGEYLDNIEFKINFDRRRR